MTDRTRNFLILLLVGSLIVGAGAAIALKKTRLGLDLKGGVQLNYKAKPTAQTKVNSESINRTIDIMRKRTDKLGVSQPEINRSGSDEISVALPDVKNVKRAEQEVGRTAQLIFYDWEPNVIGASGNPAPTEATATGGANAGAAQFGLPQYQAVLRAAKRQPELRKNETTLGRIAATRTSPERVCTAAQEGSCIYGTWYLLDAANQKVLRGPEETKENL
jgi:SecD/SecF fusion protein